MGGTRAWRSARYPVDAAHAVGPGASGEFVPGGRARAGGGSAEQDSALRAEGAARAIASGHRRPCCRSSNMKCPPSSVFVRCWPTGGAQGEPSGERASPASGLCRAVMPTSRRRARWWGSWAAGVGPTPSVSGPTPARDTPARPRRGCGGGCHAAPARPAARATGCRPDGCVYGMRAPGRGSCRSAPRRRFRRWEWCLFRGSRPAASPPFEAVCRRISRACAG
jgi:hypothetical protein